MIPEISNEEFIFLGKCIKNKKIYKHIRQKLPEKDDQKENLVSWLRECSKDQKDKDFKIPWLLTFVPEGSYAFIFSIDENRFVAKTKKINPKSEQ